MGRIPVSTALRRALLLACGSALLASAAHAQAPPRGARAGPDPERRLAHLTAVLSLSEEQQQAIRPILVEQSERMKALREENRGKGRGAMREGMQQLHTEMDARIEAELSEEQIATFREHREQQRGQRQKLRRAGTPRVGAPPAPDAEASP